MPDISSLSSPVNTPSYTRPRYDGGGSPVGSADTSLGRLIGGNYYDAGLLDYSNQANVRFGNQGRLNAFGNFLGDLGVKTLSGIPSVIGSLWATGEGIASAVSGGKFSDGFKNNPLLNLAESVSAWGDEYFPHFQEADFSSQDFLTQLTSPGQLATANVETLSFLTQGFGLAGLLGKAQVGTRVINQLAKGRTFKDVLLNANSQNLAKIAGNLDELTLNTFLTVNESALEAIDSRDQVRSQLEAARSRGEVELTDAQIEDKASQSLSNVFWLNVATAGVTNNFFTKLVRPIVGPKVASTRINELGLELQKGTGKVVGKKEGLSAVERLLFDEGNSFGQFAKTTVSQMFGEGLEENLQYSIQKTNEAFNEHASFTDAALAYAKDAVALDFSDPERVKAAGLGSLIGGVQTLGADLVKSGPFAQAKSFREQRDLALESMNKSYTDFFSNDLLKKTPAVSGKLTKDVAEDGTAQYNHEQDGKVQSIDEVQYNNLVNQFQPDETGAYTVPEKLELGEDGLPLKDEVKAAAFAADVKYHGELDNLFDLEASKENANKYRLQLLQLEKLNNLAQTAFRSGTTELLLQKLDTLKQATPEQAQELGFTDPKELTSQLDIWKQHITQLEANYLQTTNSILGVTNDPEELKRLKTYASSVGGRILGLQRLSEDLQKQLNLSASLVSADRVREIQDAFKTDDLDILSRYMTKDHLVEKEVAKLTSQKRDIDAALEDLGELYTKLITPGKGFKAFQAAIRANNFDSLKTKRDAAKTLVLDEGADVRTVSKHINKRATALNLEQKLKTANSHFYADAINAVVRLNKNRPGDLKDIISSVSDIVKEVEAKDLFLYPDEVQTLKEHVINIESSLKEKEAALEAQLPEGIPYEVLSEMDPDEIGDGLLDLLDAFDQLRSEQAAAEPLIADTKKTLAQIEKAAGFEPLDSEEDSRKLAAKELTFAAKRILEVSAFNGTTIAEDYTAIEAVNKQLSYLEKLDKIDLTDLGDMGTQIKRETANLIQQLRQVKQLVEANLRNQDLKNTKENMFYAQNILPFQDVLGEDSKQALAELSTTDPELAAMGIQDLLRQEPVLLKQLIETYTEKARNAIKGIDLLFSQGLGPRLTDESLEKILASPSRGFLEVFRILEAKERLNAEAGQNISPLVEFNKNYDVVTFIANLANYSAGTSSEQLKSLLELQAQLATLKLIQASTGNGFSSVTFLTRLRNFIKANPTLPTPTSAQIRVAYELAAFVSNNKTDSNLYTDGAALRSPAGAGKSLVVSKILKAVLDLKNTDIHSAAPYTLAAQNIAESLGDETRANTVEALTAMLNAGDIGEAQLLIVDEAGGLSIEAISNFSRAVANYNKTAKVKTKYVLLYDPNQVTPGNVGRPALDLEFFAAMQQTETDYYSGDANVKAEYESGTRAVKNPTSLAFVEKLTQITSLSSTYRADISELIDLQNLYKSKEVITEHFTASSSSPQGSLENILGTFAEKNNTIIEKFRLSQSSNPGRTRVILVGSEQKKATYESALPGALVLVVPDAAGIVRDEVYVDISPSDHANFSNIEVYNQWVYTALSRAKLYAQISGVQQVEHIVDPQIVPQPKSKVTQTEVLASLDNKIATLEKLTDQAEPPIITPKLENNEEGVVEVGWEDVLPPIEVDEPVAPSAHLMMHPTNSAFTHIPEVDGMAPMKAGDELIVAVDESPKKDGSPARRVVLMREVEPNYFERVAVIGDKEEATFLAQVRIPSSSLQTMQVKPTATDNVFKGSVRGPKVWVQPGSRPILYRYGNETTETFSSKDGAQAVLPILRKYLNDLWGPNADEKLENYEDILANPEKYVSVGVFKGQKDLERWFPDARSTREVPKIGPPYMLIHGLRTTTGRVVKTQFINLTPNVLNTKTTNMEPIDKFIKTLASFEKALAASKLPGGYKDLRAGLAVEVAGEKYYPFHEFITHLSNTHKALVAGEAAMLTLTDAKHLQALFPNVDGKKIPTKLLELASELDFLVHGNVAKGERRAYRGEAQLLMDEIGSQNLIVTTPNGKNLILRDYKAYEDGSFEMVDSKGISLLGPIKFTRKKGLAFNPLIKEQLINRLMVYRGSLIKRARVGTSRFNFVNDLLETPGDKHLSPITLEDLEDLFVRGKDKQGNYSNISEGFGLRTPLPRSFDVSRETALSSLPLELLGSNFIGAAPTALIVGSPPNITTETVEEVEPRKVSSLSKLKRAIEQGKTLEELEELEELDETISDAISEFTRVMAADTFEEAVEKYKANLAASKLYVTRNVSLFRALKKVVGQRTSSLERIREDVATSLDVKDIGRSAGNVASRDFIRATIISRILNASSEADIFTIADFARTDYYSGKALGKEDFDERLYELVSDFVVDESYTRQTLRDIVKYYNTLATEAGLKQQITYTELEDLYEIFDQLIPITTELRALARQQEAPKTTITVADAERLAIPSEFSGYLETLVSLADAPAEDFENALLSNEAFQQRVIAENESDPLQGAMTLLKQIHLERSKRFLGEELGRELEDTDITDYVQNFTGQTPLGFFKQLLKGRPNELTQIVKYGQLVNAQGQRVWGLYKDGVMAFARLASGKVSSRVVRHELFHKIFWEYLTPAEQIQVLNLAKETYGNLSNEGLEERLAESFEGFVQTKKPTIFDIIWNKLKRLLGFTYNNIKSIEQFFNLVENKAFYYQKQDPTSVERAAINIRSKFDNFTEYKALKTFVLTAFSDIQESRRSGRILSFSEILEAVVDRMKDFRDNTSRFKGSEDSVTLEDRALVATIDKVLKDGALWKNIVEYYFGQTQTRGAVLKVLSENKFREIQQKEERLDDLRLANDPENDEEIEALDSELEGLRSETFDSMLIDPSLKLTGVVKQRLIGIKYWKNGELDFADLNRSYSLLLERFSSIPRSSLAEAIQALKANFKEFQGFKARPNIKQATGKFVLDLLNQIEIGLNTPKRVQSVTFHKDATFKGLYAIYSKDGSSTEQVTLRNVEQFPDRYAVEHQQGSTHDFVFGLATKAKVSYQALSDGYYLFEDLDFLKSVIASVSSLRKNRPIAFTERWDLGIYKVYNYLIQTGGGKRTHEANVRFAFNKHVANLNADGITELVPTKFLNDLYATKADTIEKQRAVLVEFLKIIGLKKRITDASPLSIERAYERLTLVLPKLQMTFASDQGEYQTLEEYNLSKGGEALLADEGSFVDDLTELINSHYTLGDTHSYTRGDGKKAFGWIDASYQTDLLGAMVNALVRKPFKKFSSFSVANDKLTTKDPFLQDNIFFKGGNKIHSFNDHDSWKQKGNERFAKYLRKENLTDFRKRHIVGNFISRLAVSRSKYYQSLPIPSNRTTITNVEVDLLKGEQVTAALKNIIRAQKNRPDPKLVDDNPTYAKNHKQWRFPGLEGSVDSLTEAAALKMIQEHVQTKVQELLPAFLSSAERKARVKIPDNSLAKTARVLGLRAFPVWSKNMTVDQIGAYHTQRNEIIEGVLKSFYYNFIINQYSLSQIVYGDETFYKSKEDQTKRIQIATATGDTVLVDPTHGIPGESNVLVVDDLQRIIPDDLEDAIAASIDASYDASDAEGYMLPEFYERLAAAYGVDSLTDVVLKPVYYSIENGVPRALKYSVKVLTDELVEKFPHLASYRQAMRDAKADQMVFASGVKIGGPSKAAKLLESGEIDTTTISDAALVSINNNNLRFQLNPASDIETSVSNPSQGTAMQNTNGQNSNEIFDLHQASALIIDNGVRQVARDMRLTPKGGLTQNSETMIRNKLQDNLEGLPGGRDVYELLKARNGQDRVSFNLPLIADRVVSSLSSMITSATTGFRFKGSKLVLQADLGKQEVTNPDGTTEFRNLKWRDEEGYCEVLLPEEYKDYMTVGDKVGISKGLVGFRIPTTNYHSLLPMKVVGFYPSPEGAAGNVIIAPSLIVYYHGSDYDLDSLFVIRKETNRDPQTLDLNPMLKEINPAHKQDDALVVNPGDVYGYSNGEPVLVNGSKLRDYLTQHIVLLTQQIATVSSQIPEASYAERSLLNKQLSAMNDTLRKLTTITEVVAKNDIVHNFASNLLERKNRADLLTPISFDDILRVKSDVEAELATLLTPENLNFYQRLAASGLIQIKC